MRGEDLFRMKGVIAIRDFPETFVFQVGASAQGLGLRHTDWTYYRRAGDPGVG